MANYPRISKGEGKFTADVFNRVMDMMQWHEVHREEIQLKRPTRREIPQAGGKSFWVAQIVSSASLGSEPNARWQYQWEEVRLNSDTEWEPFEGGKASEGGDPNTFALNLVEWNNDGQGVEGYGYDVSPQGSDMFTASVTTTPILAGSFVQMWFVTEPVEDGAPFQRAIFQAPNEPAVKVNCVQDTGIGGTR